MKRTENKNNPEIKAGDTYCGFIVKRAEPLKTVKAFFYQLEDENTGAKYIHIANQDQENTFGAAFKTIPEDSTGAAHILEHSVLCGSKKYPVRDPFFSMLKRSLSTFMNAFTSSDWTMYPFSTQNKKDFFNLMDVYLDAVFFPTISELSFKQEGWRLETDEADNLVYKGIVYNEMKGAMSSQDQIMSLAMKNSLCPNNTYKNNSGGDPQAIPNLTYDNLIKFHKRFYHPANAFFYSYGNFPLKDNLTFIREKVLNSFNYINPNAEVLPQPRWDKPKTALYYYPADKQNENLNKCQATVAWLISDINDSFEMLVLDVLTRVLLSNSASPLYKALTDSKLGEALADCTGFDADNKDTIFSCGLKGVEKASVKKVEEIIFEVLNKLVENKIDKELVDAAIHQIEFATKEVTNSPYPYGLKLLLSFAGNWIHNGNPIDDIEIDRNMNKLFEKLKEKNFLENKIKERLLDNPHRVLITLAPDIEAETKQNKKTAEKLNKIKKNMKPEDINKIKADALILLQNQDAKEDVSTLPTLEISDISKGVNITTGIQNADNSIYYYDKPCSGIFYLNIAAGAGMLDEKSLPLLPFFSYAFTKLGDKKRNHENLAKAIATYTGGMGLFPTANTIYQKQNSCLPFILFAAKCLERNINKMFGITEEIITEFDAKDIKRLKSLITEYKSGLESSIVASGHMLALSLASRNFSKKTALDELWHGVTQFQYIKEISKDLSDSRLKEIAENLNNIAKTLFAKNNLKIALIGEKNPLQTASALTDSLKEKLANKTSGFCEPSLQVENSFNYEGWSFPSAVSFAAQTFKTASMPHKDAPSLAIIGRILRLLYLHKEIREKGGAYGGMSLYNQQDGIFGFASYRDPHIISTLKTFEKAGDFIKNKNNYTNEDIKEAILQVCSDIDKPDTPATAAKKAFFRRLVSMPEQARKNFKEKILLTDKNKILKTAEKYFNNKAQDKATAVISGQERLDEANKKLKDKKLKLYKI